MPIELELDASPQAVPERAAKGRAAAAKGVDAKQRMFFTERLELLLETGVPLHSGLEALAGQSDSDEMRRLLNPLGVPDFEASATTGEGVFETLKAAAKGVLTDLKKLGR